MKESRESESEGNGESETEKSGKKGIKRGVVDFSGNRRGRFVGGDQRPNLSPSRTPTRREREREREISSKTLKADDADEWKKRNGQ